MIHRGSAFIATITATFHPNCTEKTNDRSGTRKCGQRELKGKWRKKKWDVNEKTNAPKYSGRKTMLKA
jgi:hypothetical protein